MTHKTPIACLLSGAGTTMAALLYASRLPSSPFEVVLVAGNDPAAPGLALAAAEGIATFARSHRGLSREDHEAILEQQIARSGAELIALCGYMRILTAGFVTRHDGRILNTHPSLLPKYRGLDTHARALEAGDSHAGCSVHIVTPELDDGPLLGQLPVAILPGDTPETLARRVQMAEYQLYPRTLAHFVARPYDAAWLLDQVRALTLAMPEAEERESHGAPGWRTSGKSGRYFAYFNDRHHGSGHVALLVRTGDQTELEALVEQDPETYFKPAYYGASGWLGIILEGPGVDWQHVARWIERSWRAVAPGRLTTLHAAADDF